MRPRFVTKDEVIYLAEDDGRIVRVNPDEPFEAVVACELPREPEPEMSNFCVAESGTFYVKENNQRKVFALHPGKACWTEVLQYPPETVLLDFQIGDGSLYLAMAQGGLWEFKLPPELQLE